jgi:hypothetical protein
MDGEAPSPYPIPSRICSACPAVLREARHHQRAGSHPLRRLQAAPK